MINPAPGDDGTVAKGGNPSAWMFKEAGDGFGVLFHVVAFFEGGPGATAHLLSVLRGEGDPVEEEFFGSCGGVGLHEACTVFGDLGCDVDGGGEEGGAAAGEGFGYGDAEVFLVGGEDEDLGCVEGTPLGVAIEHAGPVDAVGYAGLRGFFFQGGGPAGVVWASHDELEAGVLGGDFGKGVDQEVAAFFDVDAAEEEDEALFADGGADGVEGFNLLGGWCAGWTACADGGDVGVPVVQPEALFGEAGFFVGGEEDAVGVAEDPVLGGKPVGPLFEVLAGVFALEPWVQHAVSDDDVGGVAGEGAPCGEAGVLPHTVDDDALEAVAVGAEPGDELLVVAEGGLLGSEGVNGEGEVAEEGGGWVVEGDDFALVAGGGVVEEDTDGL